MSDIMKPVASSARWRRHYPSSERSVYRAQTGHSPVQSRTLLASGMELSDIEDMYGCDSARQVVGVSLRCYLPRSHCRSGKAELKSRLSGRKAGKLGQPNACALRLRVSSEPLRRSNRLPDRVRTRRHQRAKPLFWCG
jgi:hypothetical protein